jgi:hypothetical protein
VSNDQASHPMFDNIGSNYMKILDFFMVDQIVLAKGEKIGSSFHYNIINCLFKKKEYHQLQHRELISYCMGVLYRNAIFYLF